MFDHKHYVPILKTKAGERWAIDHLGQTIKQRLTPLFEIHAHQEKGNVPHAQEMCDGLESVWGTSSEFFLDTVWLHDATGDSATIEAIFDYARSIGLQAIPVVRVSYDPATLDVIRDIVAQDLRGCLFRLAHNHAGAHPAINGMVSYLAIPRNQMDLLLDYRHLPMTLAAQVTSLPNLNDWRTLIAASGAFPRSITALPQNQWHQLPRHDWMTWRQAVVGGLARRPAFSDYTIRDPGPAASFGDPSVNLRYTKDTHWLVRVGGKFRLGHAAEMHSICQSLVGMPQYDGAAYSQGDHVINEVAQQNTGPGAAQQWLQWGMNHHMTFVVNQIHSDPAL